MYQFTDSPYPAAATVPKKEVLRPAESSEHFVAGFYQDKLAGFAIETVYRTQLQPTTCEERYHHGHKR